MPSAVLTTHSTLLTSAGWTETSTACTVAAIGVDRHGQLSICNVEVSPYGDAAAVHFLGTRAAFGAFHAETVVIDASGGRRSVSSVCETEEIQELKWESCVHGGDLMRLESGIDQLWDAFGAVSLAGNKNVVMVKSFQVGLSREKRFVRLIKSQLEHDCIVFGFAGVAKRIASLLGTETDLASTGRESYRIAMWLATCRQAIGHGYRLGYDSIQHTCAVKIELDAKVGQVEPLRTAFLAGIANRSTIRWTDRSWNPVSSGFIVDGRT